MSQLTSDNLLATLRERVRADPKKTALLGGLLLLLLVLALREFGSSKSGTGPAPADARAIEQSDLIPGLQTSTNDFTSSTPGGSGSKETVARNAAVARWLESAVDPMQRDIFTIRYDRYATQEGHESERSGRDFADSGAKSARVGADGFNRNRTQIDSLRAAASRLQLNSVWMGASPKAVVDGRLVGVGDVVAEFRVLEIEARRIVVERDGIRIEILMR